MPEQSTIQHLKLYPTPEVRNMLVVEVLDATLPTNQKPPQYGKPHPRKDLFPAHVLSFMEPMQSKPGWQRLVYACEYVEQDAYNYTTRFSGESNGHPIYTRAYIFPRKNYKPAKKKSADPLFKITDPDNPDNPQPILVQEEMREADDERLKSLYVAVIRVYETLPGPVLIGVQTDPESNVQYPVKRQFILADAALPANGGGIVYEKEPLSTVKAVLVIRDLSPLIGVRFETYPEISYVFPGLLVMRGGVISATRQPASYRSSFSRLIRARVVTYYTLEAEDNTDDVFDPYTINVRSDGGNFGSVLHNIRTSVIGGRRQRVDPSFPASTEYPVGEEVLIRAPSERGENALYKNTLTYINLL